MSVLSKCKTENRNSQREHGQPLSKTRATRVWLAVNQNTSASSGE